MYQFSDELRIKLREKQVVPYVGTEISMSVKSKEGKTLFPNWIQFINNLNSWLINECRTEHKLDIKMIDLYMAKKPPLLSEALKYIHDGLNTFDLWNEYFQSRFKIQKKYIDEKSLALARSVWTLADNIIITINYDETLERAYPESSAPCSWGIDKADRLLQLQSGEINRPVVWHLHGSINNASETVIAVDGYEDLYMAGRQTKTCYNEALDTLAHILAKNSLLFVGVRSHNLHVFREIRQAQEQAGTCGGPHYCLVKKTDEPGIREKICDLNIKLIPFDGPLLSQLDNIAELKRYNTYFQGFKDFVHSEEELIPAESPILVKDLWKEALTGEHELIDEAEEFVESIGQAKNNILNKELTSLQRELWNKCQKANLQEHPFHSHCNVIVTAPTSSGKTAVAEIFLFLPLFYSEKCRSSIYLAPTRALTQMKYRELIDLYGRCLDPETDEPLEEQIIISTGEDMIHDSRLAKRQFIIACVVYEKANVIFSQRKDFLSGIGSIVIDELHMLQNPQRGPVLEMLIAKALYEQKQQKDMAEDCLKIVAISTEGSADKGLNKLFNVIHEGILPPVEINSISRPVPIRHYFILPPIQKDQKFTQLPIAEFNNKQNRIIPFEKREDLKEEINRTWREYLNKVGKLPDEFSERTMYLLKSLLKGKQEYRLLIFVSSKTEALKLARLVKDFFRTQKITPWNMVNQFEFTQIIEEAEDEDLTNELLEFAAYGVFVHHADIDRQIRPYIEDLFSNLPNLSLTAATPQVIIATQTLSYGINMALHDVVILSGNYPVTNREGKIVSEKLNVCAFHNMAGRAGRLGKLTSVKHANIYIIPKEQNYSEMIDQYYNTPPNVSSQIFSEEDTITYWLLKKNNNSDEIYKDLQFVDYTYPFARTIMDALRHFTSKNSSARIATYISPEDLKGLLKNTLYYYQKLAKGDSVFQDDFEHCMRGVLWTCSSPDYQLVDRLRDEERYSITELGESAINTGTEFKTIAPMIKNTINFYEIWRMYFKEKHFPVCLYLLVIISLKEIFLKKKNCFPEKYIKSSEWKKNKKIALNRQEVFSHFQKILAEAIQEPIESLELINLGKSIQEPIESLELINNLAKTITDYLDRELLVPNLKGGIGYPQAYTDMVLRFFCAVMVWINMDKLKEVHSHVEKTNCFNSSDSQSDILGGFQKMADQVSWKLLFLWKLRKKWHSSKATMPELNLEQEIELLHIVSRIRIGCTIQGVYLSYPCSSNFSRNQIINILKKGVTPTFLLSSEHPEKHVKPRSCFDILQKDIQNFVKHGFESLTNEITITQDAEFDNYRKLKIIPFWKSLSALFNKSISEFTKFKPNSLYFDQELRHFFNVKHLKAESPLYEENVGLHNLNYSEFIEITHPPQAGMVWRESSRKNIESRCVKILGLQFNKSWGVFCGSDDVFIPFNQLLEKEAQTPHLVFVTLPWSPYLKEVPPSTVEILESRKKSDYTTVLISPTAFATIVTAIVNHYVQGNTFIQYLTTPHSGMIQLVLTQQILKICDIENVNSANSANSAKKLPESLREELIRFFEVEKY
ncbi:MAG: DEAD/DEAH box helicase [Desulfobacteraceae bacterium]|nr:DEAD/DEAH box helicase [Desulfobacteraceae bacterium]